MDFNIDVRRKQLESIDQFISSAQDRVDSIIEHFGWTREVITKDQPKLTECTVNPSHTVPLLDLSTHEETCTWREENYADDDKALSEPNPIAGSTVFIDNATKTAIFHKALAMNPEMKIRSNRNDPVPKTSNRLIATYTTDERLALYDHAVSVTKGPPKVPEFNIAKPKYEGKRNLTIAEMKSLERDAKRRRIKYKSESIHPYNKSATEVLKELIDSQMDQYVSSLKQEIDINNDSLSSVETSNSECSSDSNYQSANEFKYDEKQKYANYSTQHSFI